MENGRERFAQNEKTTEEQVQEMFGMPMYALREHLENIDSEKSQKVESQAELVNTHIPELEKDLRAAQSRVARLENEIRAADQVLSKGGEILRQKEDNERQRIAREAAEAERLRAEQEEEERIRRIREYHGTGVQPVVRRAPANARQAAATSETATPRRGTVLREQPAPDTETISFRALRREEKGSSRGANPAVHLGSRVYEPEQKGRLRWPLSRRATIISAVALAAVGGVTAAATYGDKEVASASAVGQGFDEKGRSDTAFELATASLPVDVYYYTAEDPTTGEPLEMYLPYNENAATGEREISAATEDTHADLSKVQIEDATLYADVYATDQEAAVTEEYDKDTKTHRVTLDLGKLEGQISVLEQPEDEFYLTDTITSEGEKVLTDTIANADKDKPADEQDKYTPELMKEVAKNLKESLNDDATHENLAYEGLTAAVNAIVQPESESEEELSGEYINIIREKLVEQAEARVTEEAEKNMKEGESLDIQTVGELGTIRVIGQGDITDDRGWLARQIPTADGKTAPHNPVVPGEGETLEITIK